MDGDKGQAPNHIVLLTVFKPKVNCFELSLSAVNEGHLKDLSLDLNSINCKTLGLKCDLNKNNAFKNLCLHI